MRKKVYCKPELTVVELQATQLIAASGGTNLQMPPEAPRFLARDGGYVPSGDDDDEGGQIEDMGYESLF